MISKNDGCKPDAQTVWVTIALNTAEGIIQCTPDCIIVHHGQAIEWKCEGDLAFAIHLGYDTPFDKVHHQAPQGQHIRLDIPTGKGRGRYKYVVAVTKDGNVWIEDPIFIVRP